MSLLRLFGALDLRAPDGEPARALLAQPKRVAVLVVLGLSPEGRAKRERILGLLWPDLPDDRARNALSKALHHIRSRLGDGAVVSEPGDELRLDREVVTCDALEFRDAVGRSDHRAVISILERGELLGGFQVSDASEFETWLEQQQEATRRWGLVSLTALAEAAEIEGDITSALALRRRATDLAPWEEAPLRALMSSLARSGDRSAALDEFARFEARLASYLEVEPSRETRKLLEEIRAGQHDPTDPAIGPPDATSAQAHQPDASSTPSPPTEAPKEGSHRAVVPARRAWLALAAAGGVLTVLASQGWLRPGADHGTESDRVVVVLPFEPADAASPPARAGLEAFGSVAADWVVAALSRTGVVDVVPSRVLAETAVEDSAGGDPSLALARALGASLLVEGRYDLRGDSLTVHARITDAGSGAIVRALDPVSGDAADPSSLLVRVHDRVAGALAGLLDARIAVAATATSSPPSYSAYLEYVAGLEPWRREEYELAAGHFGRAFEADSSFVSVLPWLWESLTLSGQSDAAREVLALVEARRDRLGAYDLAALDWLRSFGEGNRQGALMAGRRMAELAPTSQDANWSHGWAAVNTGRYGEALAAFARVERTAGWMDDWASYPMWPTLAYHLLGEHRAERDLARTYRDRFPDDAGLCAWEVRALAAADPRRPAFRTVLDECLSLGSESDTRRAEILTSTARELRYHGNPTAATALADSAVALASRGVTLEPGVLAWRRVRLGALLVSGRWEEVVTAVEGDLDPPLRIFYRMEALGIARARLGDQAGARAAIERMRAEVSVPGDSAVFFLRQAGVLAHLGERDEALRSLRAAVRRGFAPAEVFHAQVAFEPLWNDPEFEAFTTPRR